MMMKKCVAFAVAAALFMDTGAPLAVWGADNATLDGIAVSPDQVKLHLSEQTKFNTFVTAEPPRIVIELLGVEHAAASKLIPGQGQYLKRVRSGQYQRDPSLITRVVLDLYKLVTPIVKWSGNDLVVSLASLVSASQKADSSSAASAKPEDEMSAETSAEINKIAKSRDASGSDSGSEASSLARDASQRVSTAYASADRPDIVASLSREPISLDFDNTDIREILRLLAAKAHINIVYGADVTGTLTLHLTDVPFNEAFTTILSMQGLVANQVGESILRVMTPAALQKERAVAVNQTRVIKLKYSKADDIQAAIQAVRQAEQRAGKLVTDPSSNSLIVTDTLDGISSVERLLSQLDTRPVQVLIEAKLVEVKLSKGVDFGIQWDYTSSEQGKLGGQAGTNLNGSLIPPAAASSPTLPPLNRNATAVAGAGASGRGTGVLLPADKIFGALTLGRITNNYFLSATLTAAANEGKVKVLSDPKITTLNGKQASINITTSIPYVTSNVASTGVATQTVSYTVTGIQLSVTPTVNADGRITLNINPTVSQPSATAAANVTTGAPAVDSRTAQTMVLVRDGETIVIGGLITDSISNTIAKVPLLGDIPFLGWLFKKKTVQRDRVELLIFVTTKVVPS